MSQVEKFALLEQTCSSLERLEALGATDLFWGESAPRTDPAAHLAQVRRQIEDFRAEVKRCEDRRHAVVDQIDQGHEVLAILEEDLFDLRLEEEERQNEWLIEREISELPDRAVTYAAWREAWVAAGCPWRGADQPPPPSWNPAEQLRRVSPD